MKTQNSFLPTEMAKLTLAAYRKNELREEEKNRIGIYAMRYEQTDFGTERTLTVFRKSDGIIIGQRDPFWATQSVPLTQKGRLQRFSEVAREIIAEYEAKHGTA